MGAFCSKCTKTKNNTQASEMSNGPMKKESNDIILNLQNQTNNGTLTNVGTNNPHILNANYPNNFNELPTGDFYFDKEEMIKVQKILEDSKLQVIEKRQIINYKKGSLIGEGSYGRVYQGFDEDIGQIIAIKEIDLRKITNNNYIEAKISSFESEIGILSQLNHKNIVKYYGTNRTKDNFHIFLEFCIGGSIAKMLDVYKFFTENVIKKYTRQILEGLEYLHAHNVIHRDIKGANILVERDGLCKLSDFGGAKVIKDEIEFKQQNSFKGTPNWMAPETVKHLEYTRFSDIWSIGCTIIEMATGEAPWAEYKNPMAALYNLMHTSLPPKFPDHLSETCKHFLSCCLKINPKERLNVTKLLRHPFIIGDSPYTYEINPNVDVDEFRKKHEESKLNTNTDSNTLNTNLNKPFIADTINTQDIKLEDHESLKKISEEQESNNKRISLKLPRRKRPQSNQ